MRTDFCVLVQGRNQDKHRERNAWLLRGYIFEHLVMEEIYGMNSGVSYFEGW